MSASGAAWREGWTSFRARPERILLPVLAAGVGWVVVQVLVQIAIGATVTRGRPCIRRLGALLDPTTCNRNGVAASNALVLSVLGLLVLGQLFWAVALRGAAALDADRPPLPPVRRVLVPATLLALVLGVLITVGLGFAILPGLLIALFTQFAMAAVVLDGRGCFGALSASVRRLTRQPVAGSVFAGLVLLTLLAGVLCGLVGVWPAACVAALAQVRFWRREPLAAGT